MIKWFLIHIMVYNYSPTCFTKGKIYFLIAATLHLFKFNLWFVKDERILKLYNSNSLIQWFYCTKTTKWLTFSQIPLRSTSPHFHKTTTNRLLFLQTFASLLMPWHDDSNQISCGNVSKIFINQALNWLQILPATKTTHPCTVCCFCCKWISKPA